MSDSVSRARETTLFDAQGVLVTSERLYLDDVSTEIGKQPCTKGGCDEVAEFENPQSSKRSRRGSSGQFVRVLDSHDLAPVSSGH